MNGQHIKQLLIAHKERLSSMYPLASMALSGSYADGMATGQSDVDILVEFNKSVSFEFVDLSIDLEELLKKPVDLVTKQAIRPKLLPYVTRQLQYV